MTKNDLTDGVKLLRHVAIGGLSRSQFPAACAQALLNRLEALEVELRKYEPSLPSVLPVEPAEERTPIDSPSEVCQLIGCKRRDDHQHIVVEHPNRPAEPA